MLKDNSLSSKILSVIVNITMLVTVIITIYPVLNVLACSLSSARANDRGTITIFPQEFTLQAYQMIWEARTVPRAFKNSVIYTIVGTVINLLLTTTFAYPLSRKRLALKKFYIWLIVIPMYFSGGLIPMFLLVKNLGLYNTMWALILPGAISTTNLLIMRTFFQNIPSELEESAYLDGASEIYIYWKIILPLSKAALATIGLYYAVGHWNSWFSALIYLSDSNKYPLQLVLRQIVLMTQSLQEAAQSGDLSAINELGVVNVKGVKYATLFVSMLPMLIVYPFIQKYFVKGVMIGSLKE